MRRPTMLSPSFVARVRTPGRFGDGRGSHGLSLLVRRMANGRISKSWSQRLRLPDRVTNIGLGAFPVVTLAEARKAALENRRLVAQGLDPFSGGVPTFAEAVEKVILIHREGWKGSAKTEAGWRATLRDYAMPRLGRKTVDAITTADVMGVLLPIWTAKPETARRVRRRISAICKWAIAEGHRQDDPAGEAIAAALPKANGIKAHMRALPHAAVAGALAKVRASGAWLGTKLAFEFLTLTAARSGEVRMARWEEMDGQTWTIPAERTKSARPHRVPLSKAALAVLDQAAINAHGHGLPHGPSLVFSSIRGRALSDSTISKLLRENDIEAVPHGFRSSFRDWAAESGQPRELAELALGHVVQGTEGCYLRTDRLLDRRTMMERWGDYVSGSAAKGA